MIYELMALVYANNGYEATGCVNSFLSTPAKLTMDGRVGYVSQIPAKICFSSMFFLH